VELLAPPPRTRVEPAAAPTISIVIPCYQASATVADAVSSAIAQTRPAHEVVVCDDGSTDEPEHALAPFLDRITLLRKSNGGGASALNHAARVATGEFVAILDADDSYDARRIEALAALAAARPDLDILATDAWLERDGTVVGRYFDEDPFAIADQRAAILRTCFPGGWPAVRRACVLDAGGWDESYRITYDWECWLRLIHGGAAAGAVAEPLMTYRMHAASLSADPVASLRERVRMFRGVDRTTLAPHEREALDEALGRDGRRLAGEEIAAAIRDGSSRIALLRAAGLRGAPWRARLRALRAVART
jgi:hypothetical protein